MTTAEAGGPELIEALRRDRERQNRKSAATCDSSLG
jgi:hypothetical protein